MSSVIILSSPPKTFARSPTPVKSSSPLPSPRALFNSQASQQTPKKFKTVNVHRDGLTGGFSNAKSLLGKKIGAENVPIRSPKNTKAGLKILSPKRFKSSVSVAKAGGTGRQGIELENEDPIHDEAADYSSQLSTKAPALGGSPNRFNSAPAVRISSSLNTSKPQSSLNVADCEPRTTKGPDDLFELPNSSPPNVELNVPQNRKGDVPRARQRFSPLNIDMAVTRRTDWTPTKDAANDSADDSSSISMSRSFSARLIGSFGYNRDPAVVTVASRHEIDTAPTKRRRIDVVDTNMSKPADNMASPKPVAIKKPKAPPKKALTITGLATSNYFGKENEDDEPTILDQFLSTQARALDTGHDDIDSEIAKVKAVKKQRTLKKTVQKSTLVSPTSAIKAFENQDALFGSASQLARDESPSLLRDTLEAIRQSESHNFSSPVRTQDTEHASIDSTTPQVNTGVSRFARTRGLWSAAGRDEDNALLHIDTIDIDSFDTPDVRQAFPGKDVLVQPSASHAQDSRSPEKLSPSLRGGGSLHPYGDNFWDIDQMEMPMAPIRAINLPQVQVRALHRTTRPESPRKHVSTPPNDDVVPPADEVTDKPTKVVKKRTPNKPGFAGFTTERLQKQIAAYGFKPMKKREQMIAVLEKCWEQKHAQTKVDIQAQEVDVTEEIDDSLKHGDYLSNVHGLANRPVPKEKKVPKPRKPKEPKEPKEPKPRKKREPEVAKEKGPSAPKIDHKKRPKADLSAEKFVDIDNLENPDDPTHASILNEARTGELAEKAIEKVAAKRKTAPKTPKKAKQPATEPVFSSPNFATPVPLIKGTSTSTDTSLLDTSIEDQISLAITSYRAPPSTNHQKEPTWHEKILLYDPIVLEDLATWLNTVGLGAIGEDREVSALEIREWCEARGICCLWKGGWWGNKTKE